MSVENVGRFIKCNVFVSINCSLYFELYEVCCYHELKEMCRQLQCKLRNETDYLFCIPLVNQVPFRITCMFVRPHMLNLHIINARRLFSDHSCVISSALFNPYQTRSLSYSRQNRQSSVKLLISKHVLSKLDV